ncbi:MAG: 50S ribosomal protein L30 [Dehalococcoidia bacterium]
MDTIKITWKKSTIGYSHRQRKIIESLGLKRLNHTVEHQKTDSIMGMVNKVQHLVDVTE